MSRQKPGVAHAFWERVERERAARGLTKTELSLRSGIPRPTIDNLATSTRAPLARIVHALADGVGIDRDEALELAGIIPPRTSHQVDVRDAITRSAAYSDEQKQVLLSLVDLLDQANRGQQPSSTSDERAI